MRKINRDCQKYIDLMTEQNSDRINTDQKKELNEHLTECKSCRKFNVSSTNVAKELRSGIDKTGVVFPKIQKELIDELYPKEKRRGSYWLKRFAAIFEYRIPVYQAAVAFIILFLIMISDFSVPTKTQHSGKMLADSQATQITGAGETFPSYAWQWMDSQRVGINVKEDTIFTRFIVSSN